MLLRCGLAWTLLLGLSLNSRLRGAEPTFLEEFSNSPAISEVLSLNSSGVIVGRREVAEESVLSMKAYVRENGVDRDVPIPTGFTHVEAFHVSDSGHVVGFATRPVGHPEGNQRAYVWNLKQDAVETLPLTDDFRGSCAFDISQDGKRVCGYVLGRNPPRIVPCVWTKDEEWSIEVLPCLFPLNPLLASSHVAISNDGRRVAASLVTRVRTTGVPTYGLFLWTLDADGTWIQSKVAGRAVHLGDVNNEGTIAGRVLENKKRRAYVCTETSGGQILPLPPGRDSAYATSINDLGEVVGVAEDAPGPEGTSSAFLWRENQLTDLPLPPDVVLSTANRIDNQRRVGGMIVRSTNPETEEGTISSYVLKLEPSP